LNRKNKNKNSNNNNPSMASYTLFLVLLLVLLSNNYVLGEDKVVSWAIGSADLPGGYSAAIGDTVTFQYTTTHNVYLVPDDTSYNNCDFTSATVLHDTLGPFKFTFQSADFGKNFYFVCTVANHCEQGVKLHVFLGAGTPPATGGTNNNPPGTTTTSDAHMNYISNMMNIIFLSVLMIVLVRLLHI
jgi:hypothetical protein